MIRSRDQLLEWLGTNLPSPYSNMFENGSVEVLGAFFRLDQSEPSTGWMIKITSIRKRVEHIGVYPSMVCRGRYLWSLRTTPLWGYYMGQSSVKSLTNGDHPKEYIALRKEAIGLNHEETK